MASVTQGCRSGGEPAVLEGTVRWFDDAEGWGVLDAPQVPGGCFVHYSNLRMDGYRHLVPGQRVRFAFEEPGFLQDGYRFRAVDVWPSS
jgi:CspA family cold shock protein